jgi:hypothetical protein
MPLAGVSCTSLTAMLYLASEGAALAEDVVAYDASSGDFLKNAAGAGWDTRLGQAPSPHRKVKCLGRCQCTQPLARCAGTFCWSASSCTACCGGEPHGLGKTGSRRRRSSRRTPTRSLPRCAAEAVPQAGRAGQARVRVRARLQRRDPATHAARPTAQLREKMAPQKAQAEPEREATPLDAFL